MLKLTKTGIGLLTRQYRSVLKKCFLINLGILIAMHSTKVEAGIWFMNDADGNMKVCGLDGNTSYENCISMGAYNTNYMYLYQDLYTRNEINNAIYSKLFAANYYSSGTTPHTYTHKNSDGTYTDNYTAQPASATGTLAIALGADAVAGGNYSVALGLNSTSSGIGSVALGLYSTASGYVSTALGNYSNAAKDYTTAIGYGAVANVAGSTTQGIISVGHKNGDPHGYDSGNYTSDLFSRIINVADGTDAHDAATVGQMNTALNNYYEKV